MANFVAKQVTKRYFSTSGSRDDKGNDFFYVRVPTRNGRTKKKLREAPAVVRGKEKKVLESVMHRARVLDNSFNICGIRVGWGAIVGIVPFLGDFFDTLMALWVLNKAKQADIPLSLQSRMMRNIVIDFFIGLVPFLGDIGDALFRANTMNAILLYDFLEDRAEKNLAAQTSNARAHPTDANVQRPSATKSKSGGYLQRMNIFGSGPPNEREADLEQGHGGQSRSHQHHPHTAKT